MTKTDSLGSRLRSLRNERGLRLDDVAPKVGTDAGSVSRIERDLREPSISQLRVFAQIYGVTAGALLDGSVKGRHARRLPRARA